MNLAGMIAAGAIQLSAISVGEPAMQSSNTAQSYDGVSRSVSKFYDDKNTNVRVGVNIKRDPNTLYNVTIDSGHDALKFDEDPSIKLGITKRILLGKNKSLTFSGYNKFGGDINHTPCTDDYDRKYYCGNLTAWSDFDHEKAKRDNRDFGVSAKYRIRF